jgi:hypothetical protein
MAENTKACNLTKDEIKTVMAEHGRNLSNIGVSRDSTVERLSYLNKRLNAFDEAPEQPPQSENKEPAPAQAAAQGGWA